MSIQPKRRVSTTFTTLSNWVTNVSLLTKPVSKTVWNVSSKNIFDAVCLSLYKTTGWLTNVSLQADNAYSNVTSLTDTVNNLSGVIYTVNNLLKSVSLTASYISSNILAINLSLTSVSGRCNALENTQNTTILSNLQTLTTTSGYLNSYMLL